MEPLCVQCLGSSIDAGLMIGTVTGSFRLLALAQSLLSLVEKGLKDPVILFPCSVSGGATLKSVMRPDS
jgi:hypothetical protein